jgi:23S rRNA U2552 (ribose-2'-O)-methylase RlmE/FtsJ
MSSPQTSHTLDHNVPHTVSASANGEDFQQTLDTFWRQILACSALFVRLSNIKDTYGNDHRVCAQFNSRRKHSSFDIPNKSFRDQFEDIFASINDAVGGLFVNGNVEVFLDLGCAPGGFSKFLLEKNPGARGLGITLPGIPVIMDCTPLANTKRYLLKTGDITHLNFDARDSKFHPPPTRVDLEEGGYDLIIAGAFPTGQKVSTATRAILALSQLHAILSNIRPGGTCVVVANTTPFLWNAEMFAVLRRVFQNIQPAKHGKLHAIRSSCYFVCMNFNGDEAEVQSLKIAVKRALNRLKFVALDQEEDKVRLLTNS